MPFSKLGQEAHEIEAHFPELGGVPVEVSSLFIVPGIGLPVPGRMFPYPLAVGAGTPGDYIQDYADALLVSRLYKPDQSFVSSVFCTYGKHVLHAIGRAESQGAFVVNGQEPDYVAAESLDFVQLPADGVERVLLCEQPRAGRINHHLVQRRQGRGLGYIAGLHPCGAECKSRGKKCCQYSNHLGSRIKY